MAYLQKISSSGTLNTIHSLVMQYLTFYQEYQESILVNTATVLSYNGLNHYQQKNTINPSYFTIVCAHPGSATC